MDAVRRALGAEQISYVGYSYGTLLGALYADEFGPNLRAAVLDGVIDPSLTRSEASVGQMVGFTRAIEDMWAWCGSEPDCAAAGDPAENYDRLLAQIDAEPMRDLTGSVVLEPARAVLAVVVSSYSSEIWPFFFGGLLAALEGDGELLGLLGESYADLGDVGASISIGCTDGGAITAAELEAMGEEMAAVAGDFGWVSLNLALPCQHWPVTEATLQPAAIAAPEAPPILVLGNRGDNATPYEWAVAVADQLRSGVLVSFDGSSHTSYGKSECVTSVADDYLIDLVVPPGEVECPAGS